MNRVVVGPKTNIRICLSAANGFLDFTHWALDLGQRRINVNIRVPNRGVHLLVRRRKGFRLQDAPQVLIDGSHHFHRHAGCGVLRGRKGVARDGRAADIVCIGIWGWVVINGCGRLALASGILGT